MNSGASASSVGRGAILWLIMVQVIASVMGGYLAGRLRTKWVNVHTDEVYFRDTAHGFLVWAVSLVLTTGFSSVRSLFDGWWIGNGGSVNGHPKREQKP